LEHFLRSYRRRLCPSGMNSFSVAVKETDLWVAVGSEPLEGDLPQQLEQFIWRQRRLLEGYIARDPFFRETFEPYPVGPGAPDIARQMAWAGNVAGVGPMAAVAGAFAQCAGIWLLKKYPQVIVENGGDLFISCPQDIKVGIYAGSSPFSGKLAVRVESGRGPWGLCTSSGTVGPSFSGGRADAAVILAQNAPLADAVATATGNLIQSTGDLKNAVDFAGKLPGVEGVLVIKDDKMAVWGGIRLEEI
jgi:ApbE superfamily uncharacterized protein (UPF0280 family)